MKETEKQIRKRGSGSCCVGEEQGLLGGSLGVATCDRFFLGGGGRGVVMSWEKLFYIPRLFSWSNQNCFWLDQHFQLDQMPKNSKYIFRNMFYIELNGS